MEEVEVVGAPAGTTHHPRSCSDRPEVCVLGDEAQGGAALCLRPHCRASARSSALSSGITTNKAKPKQRKNPKQYFNPPSTAVKKIQNQPPQSYGLVGKTVALGFPPPLCTHLARPHPLHPRPRGTNAGENPRP